MQGSRQACHDLSTWVLMAPLSQAVLLDINPIEMIGQAMDIWGAGISWSAASLAPC